MHSIYYLFQFCIFVMVSWLGSVRTNYVKEYIYLHFQQVKFNLALILLLKAGYWQCNSDPPAHVRAFYTDQRGASEAHVTRAEQLCKRSY